MRGWEGVQDPVGGTGVPGVTFVWWEVYEVQSVVQVYQMWHLCDERCTKSSGWYWCTGCNVCVMTVVQGPVGDAGVPGVIFVWWQVYKAERVIQVYQVCEVLLELFVQVWLKSYHRLSFFLSFFLFRGGTRCLRMPALRPVSQAGPMRNRDEGTSVVLRDTIRLTWWCV